MFAVLSSGLGVTGALSVAFNALSKSLSGLIVAHPVISTIVGITTATIAASAAYDALTTTSQESAEALTDMQSSYDSNKSDLESLNSELETTQSRIDELQAKGHLTLTEQSELSNLQAQNAELERTIALKEAQEIKPLYELYYLLV